MKCMRGLWGLESIATQQCAKREGYFGQKRSKRSKIPSKIQCESIEYTQTPQKLFFLPFVSLPKGKYKRPPKLGFLSPAVCIMWGDLYVGKPVCAIKSRHLFFPSPSLLSYFT